MKKALVILALLYISILISAQSDNAPVICGNYRKIYSDVLHEERILLVRLPEDYSKSDKTYPVLFKLDGDKGNFLQTFAEKPDLFDAYILGSFGFYKESLAILFDNELKRNSDLKSLGKKYLYVGNGKLDTYDPDGIITKRGDQFLESLKLTVSSKVVLKCKVYDEEGHVPYPVMYDGLKWIYHN